MRTNNMIIILLMVVVFFLVSGSEYVTGQNLPSAEVRMQNGRPTVFINEKPNALAGYCPYYIPSFYEKYMPVIYKLGFDLYFIDLKSLPEDYYTTRFWIGDRIDSVPLVDMGKDFFDLDTQAEHILQGDPDAYIIVRFTHYPPASWRKLHPAELCVNDEGTVLDTPSFASNLFWDSASKFCTSVIRYCESRSWANHVIGYFNLQLTEGTHLPMLDGWLFDHSSNMLQSWREFLNKKYGTVKELQEAYHDSSMTFENITVPKDKLRGPVPVVSSILYWQSAKNNQPLRDYLELLRDFWHFRFRQICAAMQNGVNRKVLILHDALKQPMLGWNHNGFFAIGRWRNISWNFVYPEIMAGSGHMGVANLFNNTPGFDGLLTPHDYQARGIGGVYEPEGITESTTLRGKYFFDEMDTRFSPDNKTDGSSGIGAARNDKEWAAITWRNFAVSFTRAFNSYWHHAWTMGDWFFSESIQKTIARQVEVIKESINWHHETMPGIAMILDDSAVLETNGSGHFFNEAIMWEYKMGIARCGVPFRMYLFEDLALDNFPKHRVFYFPNLFRVDDARLALLKEKVFCNGNVIVWGPGSGISDGKEIGAASAERLTGFKFEMLPANAPRRILISNFDNPLTQGLDAATVIGGPLPYGPVIMPTDGIELGLAWAKGGNNHIGLAVKEFGRGAAGIYKGKEPLGEGDYAAVFTTAVPLPANLWRNLARHAGAHIYCETNDILLADNCVVALHSLQSGAKRIALPGKFNVRDLITGEMYSRGTGEITFDLKAPETRVFLLEK